MARVARSWRNCRDAVLPAAPKPCAKAGPFDRLRAPSLPRSCARIGATSPPSAGAARRWLTPFRASQIERNRFIAALSSRAPPLRRGVAIQPAFATAPAQSATGVQPRRNSVDEGGLDCFVASLLAMTRCGYDVFRDRSSAP